MRPGGTRGAVEDPLRGEANSADGLRRRARERLDEALEILRSWVEVSSYTRNRAGVEQLAARTSARFASLGFSERAVPSGDAELGDHRVLSRGSAGPHVVFVSHLDTVYPAEEQRRAGFGWRLEGDWVIGPGVADIKGGTLVAWLALELLAELRSELFEGTRWTVLLNASEEEGSKTFPGLAREVVSAPAAACALVFEHGTRAREGTASRVTVSRRGSARFRLDAVGRAAHSGSAHAQGVSAARQLARSIERVEGWTTPERGLTFNVGLVRGGSAINTVPERASAWVDMRADDPRAFEDGVRRMLALTGAGDVASRADGVLSRVEVVQLPGYPPWPANDGTRELAGIAVAAARDLGHELDGEHRLGASDGCHVWDLAPTLDGLGPIGAHIHCALEDPASGRHPERMLVPSVAERAALVARLLERALAGPSVD